MNPAERTRLADAYCRTRYRLEIGGEAIALRVGAPCPPLDAELTAANVTSWAFVTAFNPHSKPQAESTNRALDASLAQAIDALWRHRFRCDGIDDDGTWPMERGWLIFGIDRDAAIALGRAFAQNAILFGLSGGVPELVFCR